MDPSQNRDVPSDGREPNLQWATALLINMVIGAAGALAGDNDVGLGSIVTGVWACAFCIAAMTILKLMHAMCVVAFRILSPGKVMENNLPVNFYTRTNMTYILQCCHL
jgi:hypothetical protein